MDTMTVERIEIADHWETVDNIVTDVHHRYAAHGVDKDDLLQEAALWWYGPGQRYVADYLTDENLVRLRRSIWRWCQRYAEKEKAHGLGYEPRDQQRYSGRVVADMLPLALDPDGIPDGGGVFDGQPMSKGNLAEGGDVLAALIDVRRALRTVPEDDLHFLTLIHDFALDWDKIGAAAGILPDSARRQYARIAERMARWLSNEED